MKRKRRKVSPEKQEADQDTEGFHKSIAKYKEVGTKSRPIASHVLKWIAIILFTLVGLALHDIFGDVGSLQFLDSPRVH